jgi:hypothetical protein
MTCINPVTDSHVVFVECRLSDKASRFVRMEHRPPQGELGARPAGDQGSCARDVRARFASVRGNGNGTKEPDVRQDCLASSVRGSARSKRRARFWRKELPCRAEQGQHPHARTSDITPCSPRCMGRSLDWRNIYRSDGMFRGCEEPRYEEEDQATMVSRVSMSCLRHLTTLPASPVS